MAPITSIMGESCLSHAGYWQDNAMELRTIADWEVRQRLLAVTGVSQVSVIGGEMKQYQVLTSPDACRARRDARPTPRRRRKVEHRHRGGFL